jgi:predicted metal-dependent hydrolase
MAAGTKIERAAIEHIARAHYGESRSGQDSMTILRKLIDEKFPNAIERARDRRMKELDEKRFEGRVPEWAKRLVRKYEDRARAVTLVIRHSRTKPYTSGHCAYWSDRIVVTFGGTDEIEHKFVILHELAHHRAGAYEQHGDGFYDELYELTRNEGVYRTCVSKGRAHWSSKGLKAAGRRARAKGASTVAA